MIRRRTLLGGSLAVLLTTGGASAWALDRFVIDHVEVANASSQTSSVAVAAADQAGSSTATSYSSDTAKITITTHTSGSGNDLVTYYVADVTVTDATILRSAFANDQFGENIIAMPSEIAASVGAILAINGDYYGFRDDGIVIRNGVIYRNEPARQGLVLYTDGTLKLYDETATTADKLLADGAWQTWSFGPGLVNAGEVLSGIEGVEVDTNFGNHSVQGNQPRTGIGIQPRGVNDRDGPDLRGPRRHGRLQPRWWRLHDHGVQRRPGQQPTGARRGTRHLRHHLHRWIRACHDRSHPEFRAR